MTGKQIDCIFAGSKVKKMLTLLVMLLMVSSIPGDVRSLIYLLLELLVSILNFLLTII